MRRLLVLGAGTNQAPLYRAARAMGLCVIGIDPNPHAVAFENADASHVCDLGDYDACYRIARDAGIDGVLTIAADFPMPTLAGLAHALELKGPSPEAALRATDKQHMRRAFAQAGVSSPRSRPAGSLEEFVQAAHEFGGQIIVKPSRSSGGRGVTALAPDAPRDSLRAAFDHCLVHARGQDILVEEFVTGPEYSVEGLTCGGRTRIAAITEKLTSGPPHFVEVGHNQPPDLSADAEQLLRETALAAIEALGIDDSASHVEIKLSNSGPQVIEAAARLGGGFIASHLVTLSTGVDFLQAAIRVALGDQPELAPPLERGSAVRFIVSKPGRIDRIEGAGQARELPGVAEVELYVQPGDVIQSLTDATSRLGHVICSGADRAEAVQRADAASRLVTITTS